MAESRGSKLAKRLEAAQQDHLRFVMGDARGRAFIWNWLGAAGVFESSFNTNALVMAHNEGRRSVANQMLSEIMEVDANGYLTMQAEAAKLNQQSDEQEAQETEHE